MIEIGGRPILWHIMKIYSYYGFNEFIVCLGYKGHVIKEYFANYELHASDVTFDFRKPSRQYLSPQVDQWSVTLADTGSDTMTGGRVKHIRKYIGDEPFLLTYGDGVINANILDIVSYHQSHGKLATVTAIQPFGRFGSLTIGEDNQVSRFNEKPMGDGGWVNGGFFVLQPKVLDYIDGDATAFEKEPLEQLAAANMTGEIQFQLGSFRLSDRVTNDLLMGGVGSTVIQESKVKNLLDSLRQSQEGLVDANQDPALTAANIAVIRQLFSQAETMIITAMDALKQEDKAVMSLLQKLKLKGLIINKRIVGLLKLCSPTILLFV